MPKFKIQFNKDECIGCGTCAAVCPGNWEMKDDGKAALIKEEIEELGCNRLAEENCPVRVISIRPVADKKEPESTIESKEAESKEETVDSLDTNN